MLLLSYRERPCNCTILLPENNFCRTLSQRGAQGASLLTKPYEASRQTDNQTSAQTDKQSESDRQTNNQTTEQTTASSITRPVPRCPHMTPATKTTQIDMYIVQRSRRRPSGVIPGLRRWEKVAFRNEIGKENVPERPIVPNCLRHFGPNNSHSRPNNKE